MSDDQAFGSRTSVMVGWLLLAAALALAFAFFWLSSGPSAGGQLTGPPVASHLIADPSPVGQRR